MNYELPVWYDRQQMLLGDERNYKNFIEGVNNATYFVIILSPHTISSACANEEIELIRKKHICDNSVVFPLFYNITAYSVPDTYSWMKNLVYKEIKKEEDVYSTCNHIVCKILLDELSKYKYQSLGQFCDECANVPLLHFVIELLTKYNHVDNNNYNSKITILYSIYIYLKNFYSFTSIPEYYYAGMDRVFEATRLNLEINLREIIILEKITLLLLNTVLFGYII